MPPRIAIVLERMPPALFAGLATTSVLTSDGSIGAPSVLVATLAAVIAAPLRSLMACLLAGIGRLRRCGRIGSVRRRLRR